MHQKYTYIEENTMNPRNKSYSPTVTIFNVWQPNEKIIQIEPSTSPQKINIIDQDSLPEIIQIDHSLEDSSQENTKGSPQKITTEVSPSKFPSSLDVVASQCKPAQLRRKSWNTNQVRKKLFNSEVITTNITIEMTGLQITSLPTVHNNKFKLIEQDDKDLNKLIDLEKKLKILIEKRINLQLKFEIESGLKTHLSDHVKSELKNEHSAWEKQLDAEFPVSWKMKERLISLENRIRELEEKNSQLKEQERKNQNLSSKRSRSDDVTNSPKKRPRLDSSLFAIPGLRSSAPSVTSSILLFGPNKKIAKIPKKQTRQKNKGFDFISQEIQKNGDKLRVIKSQPY